MVCLVLLGFLIYHRDNRTIRRSAPLVTITLLIGATGLALAQLLTSFARTNAWCTINLYLFHLSMNLILMALLVKNYRIYKIFTNNKATAIAITESRLMMYIGITTLFYVILLTVIATALGYKAIVKQSKSNRFYQYVQCSVSNTTWNIIVQITLNVLLYIQIIASLILAFLTRNVKAEYRESKRLASFAIIIFISMLIFIPLIFTLGDSTDSQILRYVIGVEFITITVISTVALLFVPIVLAV